MMTAKDNITVAERARTEGVMRAWTRSCSMRAQAVLCASIRGCDGLSKNDPSKAVVKAMRYSILNPSCEREDDDPYRFTSFMGYDPELTEKTRQFLEDLDPYPFHFVQHLAHAAHIIAIHYRADYLSNIRHYDPDVHPPDPIEQTHRVRAYYRRLYEEIVKAFHAEPEGDEALLDRLSDR